MYTREAVTSSNRFLALCSRRVKVFFRTYDRKYNNILFPLVKWTENLLYTLKKALLESLHVYWVVKEIFDQRLYVGLYGQLRQVWKKKYLCVVGLSNKSTFNFSPIIITTFNPISTGGALFSPHQSKFACIFLWKGNFFPNVNEFFSWRL